jgi:hypothetical protein
LVFVWHLFKLQPLHPWFEKIWTSNKNSKSQITKCQTKIFF